MMTKLYKWTTPCCVFILVPITILKSLAGQWEVSIWMLLYCSLLIVTYQYAIITDDLLDAIDGVLDDMKDES